MSVQVEAEVGMEAVRVGDPVEFIGNTRPDFKGRVFCALGVDDAGLLNVYEGVDNYGQDVFFRAPVDEFYLASTNSTCNVYPWLPCVPYWLPNLRAGEVITYLKASPKLAVPGCTHEKQTRQLLKTHFLYCPICDVSEDLK